MSLLPEKSPERDQRSGSKRLKLGRRRFLSTAGRLTLGLGVAPMVVPSSVLGLGGVTAPSDRITVGLIGNGQMMRGHRASMLGRGNVQVLAVCDVKAWLRDAAKAHVEKAYAAEAASGTYHGCDAYNEYERVLERPDIDAVLVATPDHWHAAISIAAMRSGERRLL